MAYYGGQTGLQGQLSPWVKALCVGRARALRGKQGPNLILVLSLLHHNRQELKSPMQFFKN